MYKRQFAEFLFSPVRRIDLQVHRADACPVSSSGLTTNFLLALEFERYKNSSLCFGKHTPMNM
jgi:hypothetical protein